MTKPISILVRGATAALVAATLIPGALWAQTEPGRQETRNLAVAPTAAARPGPSRADCDKARSDAWFARQRQMSDFPEAEPPIRADCRGDGDGVRVDPKVANSAAYGEAAGAK